MVLAAAPKICRPLSRLQIAIEPAAAGCSASRDFVHCRFADAGRRWVWLRSPTAGIRKPSQKPNKTTADDQEVCALRDTQLRTPNIGLQARTLCYAARMPDLVLIQGLCARPRIQPA